MLVIIFILSIVCFFSVSAFLIQGKPAQPKEVEQLRKLSDKLTETGKILSEFSISCDGVDASLDAIKLEIEKIALSLFNIESSFLGVATNIKLFPELGKNMRSAESALLSVGNKLSEGLIEITASRKKIWPLNKRDITDTRTKIELYLKTLKNQKAAIQLLPKTKKIINLFSTDPAQATLFAATLANLIAIFILAIICALR